MNALRNDFRFALRKLAKSPGFTAVAVLTLGLGIGLNSAVFSVINAVLFKPLPVEDPARLASVYTEEEDFFLTHAPMSYPDYLDLAAESRSFTELAAYTFTMLAIEHDGESELIMSELVSGNFFDTLGLRAARGRTFTADDDRAGDPSAVTVLSHLAWQRRFGADPGVIGSQLRVNGHIFTVIGVAPEGFHSLTRGFAPELWVPMRMMGRINASSGMNSGNPTPGLDQLDDRARLWHWTVGRLAPGVSIEQAEAEVDTFASRLGEAYPETNEERLMAVVRKDRARILPGVDDALFAGSFVVLGLVALVLLIACANLANMLLARAMGRRKEMATRLALGASRGMVIRQLLAESLALALAGGVLGLALALMSNRLLGAALASVPNLGLELTLDVRVVVYTLAAATLTAVAFGLAPALEATRTNLAASLREEARGTVGTLKKRRLRSALVIGEVALSLMLLICAGLSMRSMQNAHRIDPGFDADGLVIARFAPHLQGYDEPQAEELYRQLSIRLATMPGVRNVGQASHIPLTMSITEDAAVPEAQASLPVDEWNRADVARVGPGYFEAMGIPILRGRGPTEHDTAETTQIAVINETFAERFWPGEDAVGRRFAVDGFEQPFEVAGIARDGKYRTLGEAPRPFFYRALAQDYSGSRTLVVRTEGDRQAAMAAIRQVARELDDKLAVSDLGTIEEAMATALVLPRTGAALFGAFGAIGLLLASIGLYGVISYTVSQRTHEIGIRIAMGARRRDILGLVLKEGLVLTIVGVALGLAGAAASTRVLESVLYGVSATDLATFGGISLLLTTVAVVASLVPARRASNVDPLVALRYE